MLCVGYVGCEVFDIVLYIGRTLTKLKYRVLIIDLSASGALLHSIKHGMGLNSLEGIINFRDINYIRKIPSKEELDAFQDGVIFIIYGFHYDNQSEIECNSINIVVNAFPNVIDRVNELLLKEEWQSRDIRLLIRDITVIDDVDRIKREVSSYLFNKVSYLYLEVDDYENALDCQLSQIVRFTKLSARMQRYIMEQIHDMLPQLKYHKIKSAMASARKGV